jgi:LmbE family N-acetylglucosaminyl deacetylase
MVDLDLSKSCLVVAHPDDEVLWFSSILERVGRVVFCFEDCAEYPELGPARRALLDAYPLSNVSSLRLPEPCSVHLVDWSQPEADALGLRLNAPETTPARIASYRASFQALREELAIQLSGVEVVFTHNPWGEYGHADHVQLARVIEGLRPRLGFRLFHSGYIAHRTMPLAAAFIARCGQGLELPTQPALATALQALYREHGCWTWPVAYQRFASETFLEATAELPVAGSGFRLNCVIP